MSCKDCLHEKVCFDQVAKVSGKDFDCPDYMDSAEWLHLPCKVGDTVYYINPNYHIALAKDAIYEATVMIIWILKNEIGVAIQIYEKGCTEIPCVDEIGKTVFLTRAEAEKALAERGGKQK